MTNLFFSTWTVLWQTFYFLVVQAKMSLKLLLEEQKGDPATANYAGPRNFLTTVNPLLSTPEELLPQAEKQRRSKEIPSPEKKDQQSCSQGVVAVVDEAETSLVATSPPRPPPQLPVHETLTLALNVLRKHHSRGNPLPANSIALLKEIASFIPTSTTDGSNVGAGAGDAEAAEAKALGVELLSAPPPTSLQFTAL